MNQFIGGGGIYYPRTGTPGALVSFNFPRPHFPRTVFVATNKLTKTQKFSFYKVTSGTLYALLCIY